MRDKPKEVQKCSWSETKILVNHMLLHVWLDGNVLSFPDSSLNRIDHQRRRVLPVIWHTGVKVRVESLCERTPAVRVDVSLRYSVVEGHRPFLVVQEDADPLRSFLEAEGDGWTGAGAETAAFTPADGPVTAVGTHRDGALPVDGLPGHAKIPVCFIANLKQNAQSTFRQEATEQENKTEEHASFLI